MLKSLCPLCLLNCVDLTRNRSQANSLSLYYRLDDAVVEATSIINDVEFSLRTPARAKKENSVIKADELGKIDINKLTDLFL